jgi:hypothetical protein
VFNAIAKNLFLRTFCSAGVSVRPVETKGFCLSNTQLITKQKKPEHFQFDFRKVPKISS